MGENRGSWSTGIGFILATTGSAVGLGNIWRFPYIVGTSGGGIFVLVFLFLILGVGVPLMMTELALGRAARRNPVGAFRVLAPGTSWWLVGLLSILSSLIILSYYSVIAGWSISYLVQMIQGGFTGLTNAEMADRFAQLTGQVKAPLFYHGLFLFITVLVVKKGISGGIEFWSKILVPFFFLLNLFMMIQVLLLPGALEGLIWFLRPDPAALTVRTVLGALGQVFFSLSLGMGAILTYGSYLPEREDIPGRAILIALADLALALLAGLIIIPAVFAFNFQPDAGPGLIFITLPAVFNQMENGILFGSFFFLFLSIAALTSAISLLEVVVSYLIDEVKIRREKAVILAGTVIFLLGFPSSLSQGRFPLQVLGYSFLDFMDLLASDLALPLVGLLTAVFSGWFWKRSQAREELDSLHQPLFFQMWVPLIRYFIPMVLVYIFFSNVLS